MSAPEITEKAVAAIATGDYDFIVMNYANADMVGHSGNMEATVRAVEVLDACLARIVPAAGDAGFTTLNTADHGNADMMVDGTGGPHTADTTNWVPFIVVGGRTRYTMRKDGKLADIAPTILRIMGIPAPIRRWTESRSRKKSDPDELVGVVVELHGVRQAADEGRAVLVHETLEATSENFWLTSWLRRRIQSLRTALA